ncbi:hypothetical protein GCM10017589_62610 [Streptomyces poonensis]|nr:hypothetical protein GCM10017589_62610 [Streptomyces poonensis]
MTRHPAGTADGEPFEPVYTQVEPQFVTVYASDGWLDAGSASSGT